MSYNTYIEDSFDPITAEQSEEKGISANETLLGHEERSFQQHRKQNFWFWLRISTIFQFSCLILFGFAWEVLIHVYGYDYPYGVNLISSPAREAVSYESVLFNNDLDDWNPFKGEPGKELDEAWEYVLQYRNIAVHPSQLEGKTSVQLQDGTDRFLINLDVFHNLHCLNMVRERLFPSYYVNSSHHHESEEIQLGHINHCIDGIRQSLMCHADISIGTYSWKMDHPIPWPNFHIEHECRNWNRILEWAKKHHVPSLKGEILVHPIYGVVYPEESIEG